MRPSPLVLPQKLKVLITANEAYPAFEALFLSAESRIELGFRIFDPLTKLHSQAALEVGTNWADLITATLERGVEIDITLSDFDPIAGFDLHRDGWAAIRILHAINEITRAGAARLNIRCLLHPAKGGLASRLLFAPQTRKKLRGIVEKINAHADVDRQLRFAPRLRGLLEITHDKVKLRTGVLPKVYPVTLHQKMAIVDGHTTYIGGLDLNDRRYDDRDHDQPAQETWHDVQLIIQDEALAGDASAFLRTLPETTSGLHLPPAISSGFRTTLSRKRQPNIFALSPVTVSEGLLQEHLRQINVARSFIYIETQYFRDRRIAKALEAAAKREPNLRFLLLLPAAPDDVAFDGSRGLDARYGEYLQSRAIRRVRNAFGDRFFILSPAQPRAIRQEDSPHDRAALNGAPIIYVHAKVAIFDDISAIVASANLNGRSMKWDVETGVVLTETDQVQALRKAVLQHWLPKGADQSYVVTATAFENCRRLALSNAHKPPEKRQGFLMPYDLDAARTLGIPVPGAPEELV